MLGAMSGSSTGVSGYADRADAGRVLARELATMELPGPVVVLGLARGGVPVAVEVAAALGARADVLVVRKLGLPGQPEYGLGALAEGGEPVYDRDGMRVAGVTEDDLAAVAEAEQAECRRRVIAYRGDRPPADVEGGTAVVVDDGIATGVTAVAALEAVRQRGPARLVLAAPVASRQAVARLEPLADDLVVPLVPPRFGAVSVFYERFDQTSDAEVTALLPEFRS
jgi:putative phosphoribosyl transferase